MSARRYAVPGLGHRLVHVAMETQLMEQRQLWAGRVIYVPALYAGPGGEKAQLGQGGWRISVAFAVYQLGLFSLSRGVTSVSLVTDEGLVATKQVWAYAGTGDSCPGILEMEFWLQEPGSVWVELANTGYAFAGPVVAALEMI